MTIRDKVLDLILHDLGSRDTLEGIVEVTACQEGVPDFDAATREIDHTIAEAAAAIRRLKGEGPKTYYGVSDGDCVTAIFDTEGEAEAEAEYHRRSGRPQAHVFPTRTPFFLPGGRRVTPQRDKGGH